MEKEKLTDLQKAGSAAGPAGRPTAAPPPATTIPSDDNAEGSEIRSLTVEYLQEVDEIIAILDGRYRFFATAEPTEKFKIALKVHEHAVLDA